jgi:hypothetical protein
MSRLACAVVALLAACAVDPAGDDLRSQGETSSAPPDGAIAVIGGDLWFRSLGCPSADPSTCIREANFWIDLRVRNDAYDKHVGVVWIDRVRDDPSGPWHVALAHYEGDRGGGFETWGVDVVAKVMGGIEPNPLITYAAFA